MPEKHLSLNDLKYEISHKKPDCININLSLIDDLSFLTEREQKVLKMRLGKDGPMMKIKDVCTSLGCSVGMASVIEKKALMKLVKYVGRRMQNDN